VIVPDKILIIRPDRLGDLILSLPVAETLRKYRPKAEIYYLISKNNALLAPLVDYVDEWMNDDDGGRRLSFIKLAKKIKQGGYDCIIELEPSWRTAIAGLLSGVRLRIGTSRRFYSIFYSRRVSVHRRSSGHHQIDLELRHLQPLGIENYATNPNINSTENGIAGAKRLLGSAGNSYIVIHPGSRGSAPNWPLEYYRRLAELIKKNLDYEVVITDSHPSPPGFDGCLDLGGKTDLETLAAVLSGADLFVSGSTGPLHMADALGTLCLSFFVDRSDIGPRRWGPRRNMNHVVTPSEPCRCGDLAKCRCLEQISPEYTFEKVKRLLRKDKTTGVKGN
jgi:heptosyltransferase-3